MTDVDTLRYYYVTYSLNVFQHAIPAFPSPTPLKCNLIIVFSSCSILCSALCPKYAITCI